MITRLIPGLAVCLLVTGASLTLQTIERRLFGHIWLEPLVLAILLGAAWRSLRPPPASAAPGVNFAAHRLLELAVLLLGAAVNARALRAAGPALLAGIVAVVALSLAGSYGAGRALGLPARLATLVACGNSICGNSAIAAVAPIIGADGADVAAAIGYTAAFGIATVLGLPLLGAALHMSALRYGAFTGLTVYAVPQVLAAAAPMGAAAIQLGTLVKLVRVLMLGPICAALAAAAGRPASDAARPARGRQPLIPWFIAGFIGLLIARAAGMVPAVLLAPTAAVSSLLTLVAMAGLGLSTDLRAVAGAGPRVLAAVAVSLAWLGAASLLLLSLLRL